MICNAEIIATIGIPFNEEAVNEKVTYALKYGIRSFRFNLAKCSSEEELEFFEKVIRNLTQNKNMQHCKIMLDLPFPGKKTRISFADNHFTYDFESGETVIITGDKNKFKYFENKVIFVDNENICRSVSVGQKLVYSDGDCVLSVVKVDDEQDCVFAKLSNKIKMYTKKSLSYNYVIKELNGQRYIDLVNRIKPSSVAFSFVTSLSDLLTCRNGILDKDIEIISKIETADSIKNVDEIANSSNLMLGRGDLLLNSEICRLYEYQSEISKTARRRGKKLYIATGILTSLRKQPIPTPAEIIDLYNIISCQPDAIILNAEIFIGENVAAAVKLIRDTAARI
ncbi:pyruvate kinase [Paenibacillus sp. FSL P2-0173]|uniref:pyruvate kinase n=1 Tax=Paenibacillus sp. FSL P2-0173 TaxID=2921627 RepID=UPI0030FBE5AE